MGARTRKVAGGQKRVSLLKLLRDHPDFHSAFFDPRNSPPKLQELEKKRTECREWVRSFDDRYRVATAAQFTCSALEAFARGLQIKLDVSSRLPTRLALDDDAAVLAGVIGRDAAALELVDGLHFITSLYPALLPPRTRSSMGAFYTPPALANRLVDLLNEHGADWSTARVLDPAAGGGAFLILVAQRMISAMSGAEPAFMVRQVGARLQGLEIDPNAALLAQAALEIFLSNQLGGTQTAIPQFVRVCDSLNERADESFDVVLGNPPYGRVSLTRDQRQRYSRSLYGHANLYGVFTDLALRWTKPGGLVAYLTPTSFLAGQYYSALRRLLATEAPPLSIDFVHARSGVFEDVLQETLLATYRKGARSSRAQIQYLHVKDSRQARVTKNGTVALPRIPSDPWLAPRSPEHSDLIARAERMPSRLSDWGYSVSTGPLVWNRFKSQLTNDPHGCSVHPLIWAESLLPEGRFEFRARKRNHTPFFRLKPGDEWLVVNEPCVLVQRTTAKEQPRRLIAAELPETIIQEHDGVVVENHLNMIKAAAPVKVEPSILAALLNSEVVDQLFRCMNGSVAVSAFELEALPLPNACVLEELGRLVRKQAPRKVIEEECKRLYLGSALKCRFM